MQFIPMIYRQNLGVLDMISNYIKEKITENEIALHIACSHTAEDRLNLETMT